MQNTSVTILAAVAVVAIAGLIMSSTMSSSAVIAQPLSGKMCMHLVCQDDQRPALIKQFDGYVYCACGTFFESSPDAGPVEYEPSQGRWYPMPE